MNQLKMISMNFILFFFKKNLWCCSNGNDPQNNLTMLWL